MIKKKTPSWEKKIFFLNVLIGIFPLVMSSKLKDKTVIQENYELIQVEEIS